MEKETPCSRNPTSEKHHLLFAECVTFLCPSWEKMSGFQPWLIQKGSGVWYESVTSPHAKHSSAEGEKQEGVMNKPWGRIFTDFLQLPAGSLSSAGIFSGTWRTVMFLIQRAAGVSLLKDFCSVLLRKTFLECQEVPSRDKSVTFHYTF